MSRASLRVLQAESASSPPASPPSFVAAAFDRRTGTSFPVSTPTGTADGDVMVAFARINATSDTFTAPAGWTLLDGPTDGASRRYYLWWKLASSEGATQTFTLSASQTARVAIGTYTAASGIDVAGTINASTASKNHTATSITTTGANRLVIWCDANGTAAIAPPSGFTEDLSDDGAAPQIVLASKVYASAGATGDQTGTANNAYGAVTLAVKP